MHQRPSRKITDSTSTGSSMAPSSRIFSPGGKRGHKIKFQHLGCFAVALVGSIAVVFCSVFYSSKLTNSYVNEPPFRIAHAVSLITCHKESSVKGFLDAMIILRHSIHQNSIHRFEDETSMASSFSSKTRSRKRSKYSYQMYAILHKDGGCLPHVPLMRRLGYIPLVKDTPVNISEIPESSWYKHHVEGENCCGSKEFIKLYAYTLIDHPVVVHWDLDVLVIQPMDDLYDTMLYPATSEEGQAARQRLAIQKPYHQKLPSTIDAFFTRDITSARPWEKITAVQGGFLVARPSLESFKRYQEFILEANYTPGRGLGSGWGGLGYGGFQGAMAYQGVLAYFYDVVYPGHSVELDVCRWNQVVGDVIWRGPQRRNEFYGQCRDYPAPGVSFADNTPENGRCQDCRNLPVEDTITAHYTACKKPWECRTPDPRIPRNPAEKERLRELTNITTCYNLFREYFQFRQDVERRIANRTRVEVKGGGEFHHEHFLGYCGGQGQYLNMELPDTFDMKEVYGF
ncbi:hypothetical protein ACA910_004888 [Epithemia clementina (nom. ined.)]